MRHHIRQQEVSRYLWCINDSMIFLEKLSPALPFQCDFLPGAAAAAEVAPQNLFLWNPHWQCFAWGLAAERNGWLFCQLKTRFWAAVLLSIDPKKGEDKFVFSVFRPIKNVARVVIYIFLVILSFTLLRIGVLQQRNRFVFSEVWNQNECAEHVVEALNMFPSPQSLEGTSLCRVFPRSWSSSDRSFGAAEVLGGLWCGLCDGHRIGWFHISESVKSSGFFRKELGEVLGCEDVNCWYLWMMIIFRFFLLHKKAEWNNGSFRAIVQCLRVPGFREGSGSQASGYGSGKIPPKTQEFEDSNRPAGYHLSPLIGGPHQDWMGIHRWQMWTRLGEFVPCHLCFKTLGEPCWAHCWSHPESCGFEAVHIDCLDCWLDSWFYPEDPGRANECWCSEHQKHMCFFSHDSIWFEQMWARGSTILYELWHFSWECACFLWCQILNFKSHRAWIPRPKDGLPLDHRMLDVWKNLRIGRCSVKFRTCCACTCKDYVCKHSQPKWHCHFVSRAFVT